MDGQRFDALTRALGSVISRRHGVRAALVLVTGGSLTATRADAASKRRTCRPVAAACLRNADCCSGTCDTRRTTPRNKRNRCVCVPNCDGRICGSDGCGGFCGPEGTYGCLSGETCSDDGTTCTTGCTDFTTPTENTTMCEASTEFETWTAYGWWDPFDKLPCDVNADCPTVGFCSLPNFECFCERAWHDIDGYDKKDSEQGMCYYIRTTPSPCEEGPYDNAPYHCTESIEGWHRRHYGAMENDYAGDGVKCSNDAACVALDARCSSDPNVLCHCQIGYFEAIGSGYGGSKRQARCMMAALTTN